MKFISILILGSNLSQNVLVAGTKKVDYH